MQAAGELFRHRFAKMFRRSNALGLVAFASLVVMALNPVAPAQEAAEAPPPPDLLAGPQVQEADTELDGIGDPYRRRVPVAFEQWREMFDALDLTDTQRTAAREVVVEHRRARQAYQREHGARMRELRELVRKSREESRAGDIALTAELREIENGAPSDAAALEKLWAILTVPQQLLLQEKLRAFRAAAIERERMDAATSSKDIQADDGSDMAGAAAMGLAMTMGGTSENEQGAEPGRLDAAARRRLAFLRSHQLERPGR